ncbi:MAG: ATP synthase subunit I [Desulfobacca sp.]|uniref:ATP synthase subunit I n=1 Tax=Desulfobacca sp. TaxID=2067990 RepID=UPI00404B3183
MAMEFLTPRTMKITSWLVLAILTLAGWLAFGREVAGGILVGGLLAVLNFHLMAHVLISVLTRPVRSPEERQTAGRQAVSFMTLRYLMRFAALVVIIFLLIRSGWVHIFGLIVGLSTIVVTLLILGILESRKIFFSKVSEEFL